MILHKGLQRIAVVGPLGITFHQAEQGGFGFVPLVDLIDQSCIDQGLGFWKGTVIWPDENGHAKGGSFQYVVNVISKSSANHSNVSVVHALISHTFRF